MSKRAGCYFVIEDNNGLISAIIANPILRAVKLLLCITGSLRILGWTARAAAEFSFQTQAIKKT
jgi:hypothetical protein